MFVHLLYIYSLFVDLSFCRPLFLPLFLSTSKASFPQGLYGSDTILASGAVTEEILKKLVHDDGGGGGGRSTSSRSLKLKVPFKSGKYNVGKSEAVVKLQYIPALTGRLRINVRQAKNLIKGGGIGIQGRGKVGSDGVGSDGVTLSVVLTVSVFLFLMFCCSLWFIFIVVFASPTRPHLHVGVGHVWHRSNGGSHGRR